MAGLGRAAIAFGVSIGVLVDVDVGMKRTGVATSEGGRFARPVRFGHPWPAVRWADGL